jgi:parallel beta-helix repeat protein
MVYLIVRGLLTLFVLAIVAILFNAQPPQAQARGFGETIEVYPSPRAIRKALREAEEGDILNIHAGTYGHFKVKVAGVLLKPAGDGEVIVDAQCEELATVRVEAPDVTINGLTVRGGTFFAITLEGIASGRIVNNAVENTCEGAEYGVNVFNGGSIKVVGNSGFGWDDAVIYIGGINSTPNGPLMDTLIRDNAVTNNATDGIFLNSTSDDNIVRNNIFTGHTTDIRNEGEDNCFSDNTYVTSSGTLDPC